MNYYSENAKTFIEETRNCDMGEQYHFFEKNLINAKTILDLGFGSGRDSLYFSNKYIVYSLDPVIEFCDYARRIGLRNILNIRAQDIDFENFFDGIWACASLLHIKSSELNDVFKKCSKALKKNGIMYCSFKYGDFEGDRNGRYYLDINELSICKYLENSGLKIFDTKITDDVRKDKSWKWINFILSKID